MKHIVLVGRILRALLDKGEEDLVRSVFHVMPQRWRTRVKKELTDPLDRRLLDALQ